MSMEEDYKAYEQADKAVTDFDRRHEPKRQAIIALADILRADGWGGVNFTDPSRPTNIMGQTIEFVQPDHEPIDRTALNLGGSIQQVVADRHELVAAREKALRALPESLRQTLRAAGRSQTK